MDTDSDLPLTDMYNALEKLVALNHERAEEEKRCIIKYLRSEFQKKMTVRSF